MFVYEIDTSCGRMHLFSTDGLLDAETLQGWLEEQWPECEWLSSSDSYPREFTPGQDDNPDPAPGDEEKWIEGAAPVVTPPEMV